jgi:hypothetical protein
MLIFSHNRISLFARQRKEIISLAAVRAGADIFLAVDASGWDYIRVGVDLDLDRTWVLLHIVMNNRLLEETGIVAAFNVNLINFKKALGVLAASLHFDFGSIHNRIPLSADMSATYLQTEKAQLARILCC